MQKSYFDFKFGVLFLIVVLMPVVSGHHLPNNNVWVGHHRRLLLQSNHQKQKRHLIERDELDDRLKGAEDWNNPCGVVPIMEMVASSNQQTRASVHNPNYHQNQAGAIHFLYLHLMWSHRRVLQWINDFTEWKFQKSFEEKNSEDRGKHYPWLSIGAPLHEDPQLKYSTLIDLLYQTYDRLQRFAIAFEQLSVENSSLYFQDKFNETRIYNRMELCELESILIDTMNGDRSSIVFPSIIEKTRSLMPQVLRNMRYESDRNMRNFRIFKDYLQALEWTINGLNHFITDAKIN